MASWPACLLDRGTSIAWRHSLLVRALATFRMNARTLAEHIVWYVLDGACEIRTEHGSLTMRAGSLLWIPPGERHSAWIPTRARPILHYTFRFRVLADGVQQRFDHAPILRADARELEPELRRLHEDRSLDDEFSADRARAALHLLYTALVRPVGATRSAGKLSQDERMRVIRYARRHIARSPSSRDLARELGLSLDRFSRLFKATFGVAPRRWLVEQRIAEACFRLAHSHAPVGDIAEALGYGDRHLFNRQFRAITGRTPRQHRGDPSR